MRKTRGNVLLDLDDDVIDVLDDNDFIAVRLESDLPDSSMLGGPTPEQVIDIAPPEAFVITPKLDAIAGQLSDPVVVLDGEHLTIPDLVLLSKGLTKIRLRKIAEDRVASGRQLVETLLKENKVIIYTVLLI